jgi:hypothetical protein
MQLYSYLGDPFQTKGRRWGIISLIASPLPHVDFTLPSKISHIYIYIYIYMNEIEMPK